ncbi:hypothetical protein THRCLA_22940 [Thraustotheca clavata]|uniref:Uncharacterized protein n=1 Tax=Thraustotheca clavata TaxID=74557 RepID=A0A1V9YMU1_9STRA|nr:hypothetical protein THRCLA_22940 [Thraustotheca clavata]
MRASLYERLIVQHKKLKIVNFYIHWIVYFDCSALLTSKNGGSGSLIFAENAVLNVTFKANFIYGETTNNSPTTMI